MYSEYGINKDLINMANQTEKEIETEIKKAEEICNYNSIKVLKAFQKNRLSDIHFNATTG